MKNIEIITLKGLSKSQIWLLFPMTFRTISLYSLSGSKMASSIHLICRREGLNLKGVTQIDRLQKLYLSISWELSNLEANEIVGGWVYFHASKDTRSEFGGLITRTEFLQNLSSHGNPEVGIVFQARTEARNQKWRGHFHRMAWSSGIIPFSFNHEISAE